MSAKEQFEKAKEALLKKRTELQEQIDEIDILLGGLSSSPRRRAPYRVGVTEAVVAAVKATPGMRVSEVAKACPDILVTTIGGTLERLVVTGTLVKVKVPGVVTGTRFYRFYCPEAAP